MSASAPEQRDRSNIERLRAATPRSWLFVPAMRAEEYLPKAIRAGADAVIVDLEDATAPNDKGAACARVRKLDLGGREWPAIFVRVNASPHERLEADVGAAVASRAVGIVIPKIDEPADLDRATGALEAAEKAAGTDALAIAPMVETARAVLNAPTYAQHPRVVALAFGGGDLAADVGMTRTREGTELVTARGLVILAAAAAGVGAVDTPWLDIKDAAGAGREAAAGLALGFAGKLCIHPSHVAPVNEAFSPSAEEVARARALLEAFDAAVAKGSGVAVFEGRMIDRPDALAAKRVLARAELAARGSSHA